MQDELLRAADIQTELKIPVETLKSWRRRGTGPQWEYLGPRRVVYRRSAVEAWRKSEQARAARQSSVSAVVSSRSVVAGSAPQSGDPTP